MSSPRIISTLKDGSSFTLIELLIVIAIIGILAATVVIVLNPAQLLAQSRDSARIQDLADINTAIKQYLADNNTNLGTSSVVYVSIPDTNSSCSDLGLPSLPTGWSYHCVATTTLTHTNGTGWIPLQFSSVTTGNPLPTIPVDPINTTSTGEFYTYATNGTTYELTSYFESNNYQTQAADSGSPDPTTYALGSNMNLTPFIHGLVGYWPLNEGSGTTAYDKSGWGDNGTLLDATTTDTGPTWTTSGCLNGGPCLFFDGANDYVETNASQNLSLTTNATFISWFKSNSSFGAEINRVIGTSDNGIESQMYGGDVITNANLNGWVTDNSSYTVDDNSWHQVAVVVSGYKLALYADGKLISTNTGSGDLNIGSTGTIMFGAHPGLSAFFIGDISDAYLFNMALTQAQIQAIYNSEKP